MSFKTPFLSGSKMRILSINLKIRHPTRKYVITKIVAKLISYKICHIHCLTKVGSSGVTSLKSRQSFRLQDSLLYFRSINSEMVRPTKITIMTKFVNGKIYNKISHIEFLLVVASSEIISLLNSLICNFEDC